MSSLESSALNTTGSAGLLSATYHFMMRRIIDELSHAGFNDLSKTQLHVLARFGDQEQSLAQLSERVQIPVQVVANIANTLVRSGYITKVFEGAVLRTVRYVVTPRGYEALNIVNQGQQAVEQEWVDQLGQDEVQGIMSSLNSLFHATTSAGKRDRGV